MTEHGHLVSSGLAQEQGGEVVTASVITDHGFVVYAPPAPSGSGFLNYPHWEAVIISTVPM